MGFRIDKVKRTLREYWGEDVGRFAWNMRHLFRRDNYGKYARQDISHSYINLFVEGWRVLAYPVGHLLGLFALYLVVGSILQTINWLLVN